MSWSCVVRAPCWCCLQFVQWLGSEQQDRGDAQGTRLRLTVTRLTSITYRNDAGLRSEMVALNAVVAETELHHQSKLALQKLMFNDRPQQYPTQDLGVQRVEDEEQIPIITSSTSPFSQIVLEQYLTRRATRCGTRDAGVRNSLKDDSFFMHSSTERSLGKMTVKLHRRSRVETLCTTSEHINATRGWMARNGSPTSEKSNFKLAS